MNEKEIKTALKRWLSDLKMSQMKRDVRIKMSLFGNRVKDEGSSVTFSRKSFEIQLHTWVLGFL